jgi:DNA polymerase III epsilon subunit family exonuclease
MDRPFKEHTFVVVDVETTGITKFDRICEIGLTRITKNCIVDRFETLINPEVHITNTIFHGIEDWMVEEAPLFKDAAWHIARFIRGAVLIAHNAPFDMRFLRQEFQRLDTDLSHYALCTLKMSRRLHPDFPYHRLNFLLGEYRIENEWPHRAGKDADSEAQLFLAMSRELRSNGLDTLQSLNVWGLPYDHRWCRNIEVHKGPRKIPVLTRDDL